MTRQLERPQAEAPRRSGPDAREGAVFIGLLALSRLALLVLIGRLVRGQEFSDDVDMLLELARAPLSLLLGKTRFAQHPPLLGMFEAVFVLPLQRFASDFYVLRLVLLCFELVTAWLFWRTLCVIMPDARLRRWVLATFLVAPMGWMTSIVMAQDEVMAACFVMAVLFLAIRGRDRAALLLCGVGVVTVKVFLLVPLVALVVLLPTGRIWSRAALAFAPILPVYAVVLGAAWVRGTPPWIYRFAPTAEFGVNLWVVLSSSLALTAQEARRWSGLCALVGGLAPLWWVWSRRRGDGVPAAAGAADAPARLEPAEARRLAALVTAMLLWVFALFYHVNPEYFVLVMPILLLTTPRRRSLVATLILLTVPWAINFFFGVSKAVEKGAGGGKGVFVHLYQSLFPVEPGVLFQASLWTCIVVTLWVACAVSREAGGSGGVRTHGG